MSWTLRIAAAGIAFAIGTGGAVNAEQNAQPTQAALRGDTDTTVEQIAYRLRRTDAVDFITKLDIQGDVNALTRDFYLFHSGQRAKPLPELRADFERLYVRILNAVDGGDPDLARDIQRSRNGLWLAFADRDRFVNGVGSDLVASDGSSGVSDFR